MAPALTENQMMARLKVEAGGMLKDVHSPFKEIITIVPDENGRITGTFRNQGNKVFNYEISSKNGVAISPISNAKTDSLFDYTHMDSVELSEPELEIEAARFDAMSIGYLRAHGIAA